MQKAGFIVIAAFVLILAGQSPALSLDQLSCAKDDVACQEFTKLMEAEQYEKLVAKVDPKRSYSAAAKERIGQAYLMVAGKETNTPEQEEQFCLKALEYGATSAYMGLYFIHAGSDQQKAFGYLKQYIKTRPRDSVPYVILGEAAFEQKDYAAAKAYLTDAKQVAHGKSSNLDWLLFQASYLTGDYVLAASMLDSSFANGKTVGDLKALVSSDQRFSEMGKRPEFRRFSNMINGTSTARLSVRRS